MIIKFPDLGKTRKPPRQHNTNTSNDNSKSSITPRGLSRVDAARYLGISPSLFDELVKDGRMPPPKIINARVVWDRLRLDDAFEALPDRGGQQDSERNPWDDVA